ncbi:MAG: methylated-DNA--[protein]-cysteine S-methyltransferase [Clostridium sp.]
MRGFRVYKSDIGLIKIGYENDVIVLIEMLDGECYDYGLETPISKDSYKELSEYFKGERKEFTFPYKISGTEFQMKVWNALCKIPYGETRSYKDVAKEVGNEKASRAVGMANNKNPIAIVVPCHRVVGSNGKMVGYAFGLNKKQILLDMENKNSL